MDEKRKVKMQESKKPFVLALITARGGSIRLPRKNALNFCGHPLVAWSIIQARCSRLVDLVCLTTDDDEIADIGRRYGAKVIRRPVMNDDTTAGVPFYMAVEELEKEGIFADEIVCMLPTSPLKKVSDIDDTIQAFHLVSQFEDCTDIGTYCPERECFVYTNMNDVTATYGKPYYLSLKLADKQWRYSKLCGGWGVAKRDFLMKTWKENPVSDSVIDNSLPDFIPNNQKILAYSVEPWQCFETDYGSYFRICEALMEEFVLHGQGMEVYTRYAREFRRIVTWEEKSDQPELLDLSKYAGNSNQL
jgi:hypothetical protein